MINARGQTSPSDSLKHEFDGILNRCFDDLDLVPYLDQNPRFIEIKFCNLAMLFMLEVYPDDSIFTQSIIKKAKLIAQRFYDDATPVLIVRNGMNSIENARRLNLKSESSDLTYVSFGNSCLSTGLIDLGIAEFNRETRRLISGNNTQKE